MPPREEEEEAPESGPELIELYSPDLADKWLAIYSSLLCGSAMRERMSAARTENVALMADEAMEHFIDRFGERDSGDKT